MKDCIFCKVIRREAPGAILYEDDTVMVILDIFPVNKGHCLVIPKEHYANILDIPESTFAAMISVAKKISNSLIKAVDAEGISISMSNNQAAGQTVMHAHIHIIPRYAADGLRHWPQGRYADGEIQDYARAIQEKL